MVSLRACDHSPFTDHHSRSHPPTSRFPLRQCVVSRPVMLASGAVLSSPPNLRWLLAGALVGYALMMWTNPVRTAFRDAWRAVRRYPVLAFVPGALGCAHAAFDLAMRGYLY